MTVKILTILRIPYLSTTDRITQLIICYLLFIIVINDITNIVTTIIIRMNMIKYLMTRTSTPTPRTLPTPPLRQKV